MGRIGTILSGLWQDLILPETDAIAEMQKTYSITTAMLRVDSVPPGMTLKITAFNSQSGIRSASSVGGDGSSSSGTGRALL
jgi:hypothetical protein